jgi:2-polyprenyl-3-methyl-5-hydroxy-6-metoxy-1,4-benzoquinol methylase
MNYNKKKECICCGSNDLTEILNLGEQPLANSYHNNDNEILPNFPLNLNLCGKCYHLQLSHIVNPDLLFRNYLYVSGTSNTLRKYFNWFVDFVNEYCELKTGSVLDIACNDGTQLDYFKNKGWDTYGIDPSKNLYDVSSKNHNIVCDYFDSKNFDRKFDVITAQNVFAHNENAKEFLDNCYTLMHDDSLLFIQTSQSEMVNNNEFDTIYHEHISFFNINSFNELTKRTNLHLIDVIKTPVHGISYLFVLSKKEKNKFLIDNLISVEEEKGLLSYETYINYKKNVSEIVNDFKKSIQKYRDRGYKIIGYGAAAKGMTFLNFANEKMDFIIDDNELKQGLFTPGTNTEIKSINFLHDYNNDDYIVFVPLAWNFFTEIKEKIKKVRNNENDVYIKYFPKFTDK